MMRSLGSLLFIFSAAATIVCCKHDSPAPSTPKPMVLPTVQTKSVSDITVSTVMSGGSISSDGNSPVIRRGVCFVEANTHTPTVADQKTEDGAGTGTFQSLISALQPAKGYIVRAYAENAVGVAYGDAIPFTTSVAVPPSVTTAKVISVNFPTAVSGGSITNQGSFPITEKGVCWDTVSNPTTTNSKTAEGSGASAFASVMTGLDPTYTYYVRAYVVSGGATVYGDELKFTGIQDADLNFYSSVTIGTQVWLVENLNTTTYANGESIDVVSGTTLVDDLNWKQLTSPARTSTTGTYGMLYNGYAIADLRKICPAGWHVPSGDEWLTMINYLGGYTSASTKLRESGSAHWYMLNSATNSSGFTALPGGTRHPGTGAFQSSGTLAAFWTTAQLNGDALYYQISTDFLDVTGLYLAKQAGASVRCIKD